MKNRLTVFLLASLLLPYGAQAQHGGPLAADIVRGLTTPVNHAPATEQEGTAADNGLTRSFGRKRPATSASTARELDFACQTVDVPESLSRTLIVGPAVNLDVKFEFNSAKLTHEARQLLDEAGKALNDPSLVQEKFLVAGHTDQIGSDDYNRKLSCERALATREYLMQQHRVQAARLVPMGYGFSRLIDKDNPTSHVNRRVELRRLP